VRRSSAVRGEITACVYRLRKGSPHQGYAPHEFPPPAQPSLRATLIPLDLTRLGRGLRWAAREMVERSGGHAETDLAVVLLPRHTIHSNK
jgi:hypothetical protein